MKYSEEEYRFINIDQHPELTIEEDIRDDLFLSDICEVCDGTGLVYGHRCKLCEGKG